jgi:hypothetical protein
LSSS